MDPYDINGQLIRLRSSIDSFLCVIVAMLAIIIGMLTIHLSKAHAAPCTHHDSFKSEKWCQ